MNDRQNQILKEKAQEFINIARDKTDSAKFHANEAKKYRESSEQYLAAAEKLLEGVKD